MNTSATLTFAVPGKAQLPPAIRSIDVLSDEQLARRVQRGHTADLAALVERHHSSLLGFLYRLTGGDRSLAEDLTQEAFLRALRSIQQYRSAQRFKPWLYAIAVNAARDHFKRAEMRYGMLLGDDDVDGLADPVEWDDTRLDASQQVATAIAALPAHQREAILLRYYQDLSLAEIAEVLAIPIGTVKSRLSLGLRQLRQRLKEDDV
jgi:RNA polymerase sigma-70 factor (ECF subfamily)